MRCVSPTEVEAAFTNPKFGVSLEYEWYRSALYLDPVCAKKQTRIAAEQPNNIGEIPYFVGRLNRWVPTQRGRLFWVDHWETATFYGAEALVAAMWRGLGDGRSFSQAPGLYFNAQNRDEEDLTEMSAGHSEALGLLVGVAALLMMTYSDGWLISTECADRIEFWEGHFLFHSDNPEKLKLANGIVDDFGCKRWKS